MLLDLLFTEKNNIKHDIP